MQQEQMKELNAQIGLNEMPQCCGTGCAVCVLDYPELFSNSSSSSYSSNGNQIDSDQIDFEMLAMLEAIEQAQVQVQLQTGRTTAETGSELQ